ncbi:putative elongation factor 1-gamma [Lyophyllum shimeji]|uniref:Elongation factor 1-gamma n=1 Tax=Lyophyllum shimeji TaxID=47721 RepID=A0A9P3Q055_LYOSH|nr:putative elongation factor 1-gamma [Lyophyllum shimeji]
MTSRTLWTTPAQGSGKVIRAAAALGGVPLELPAAYEHYVDNKKPEFLAKFPHGKIPALEEPGPDGFKVFESVPIARYVSALAPDSGLLGKTLEESALVDQWIHLTESEVDANTAVIGILLRGPGIPYSKPLHLAFVERQTRALKTLNAHLATRTFFVGERITLADLYVAVIVQRAATVTLDAALRREVPHLMRLVETVVNQPAVEGIITKVEAWRGDCLLELGTYMDELSGQVVDDSQQALYISMKYTSVAVVMSDGHLSEDYMCSVYMPQ